MYKPYGNNVSQNELPEYIIENRIHTDDLRKYKKYMASIATEKKLFSIEYRVVWDNNDVHHVRSEACELVLD